MREGLLIIYMRAKVKWSGLLFDPTPRRRSQKQRNLPRHCVAEVYFYYIIGVVFEYMI